MSSAEEKEKLTQKFFRNLKNKQKTSTRSQNSDATTASASSKTEEMDRESREKHEEDLTRRAVAEICRDTEKVAKLAEEIGPSAWRKKTTKTNKRFLANTMRSVLNHNERTTNKHANQSKKKFDELTKWKPKFGERIHSFHSSSERLTKQKKSNES